MSELMNPPLGTPAEHGRVLIEKRVTAKTVGAVVAQLDDVELVNALRESDYAIQKRQIVGAVLEALGRSSAEPFLFQYGRLERSKS